MALESYYLTDSPDYTLSSNDLSVLGVGNWNSFTIRGSAPITLDGEEIDGENEVHIPYATQLFAGEYSDGVDSVTVTITNEAPSITGIRSGIYRTGSDIIQQLTAIECTAYRVTGEGYEFWSESPTFNMVGVSTGQYFVQGYNGHVATDSLPFYLVVGDAKTVNFTSGVSVEWTPWTPAGDFYAEYTGVVSSSISGIVNGLRGTDLRTMHYDASDQRLFGVTYTDSNGDTELLEMDIPDAPDTLGKLMRYGFGLRFGKLFLRIVYPDGESFVAQKDITEEYNGAILGLSTDSNPMIGQLTNVRLTTNDVPTSPRFYQNVTVESNFKVEEGLITAEGFSPTRRFLPLEDSPVTTIGSGFIGNQRQFTVFASDTFVDFPVSDDFYTTDSRRISQGTITLNDEELSTDPVVKTTNLRLAASSPLAVVLATPEDFRLFPTEVGLHNGALVSVSDGEAFTRIPKPYTADYNGAGFATAPAWAPATGWSGEFKVNLVEIKDAVLLDSGTSRIHIVNGNIQFGNTLIQAAVEGTNTVTIPAGFTWGSSLTFGGVTGGANLDGQMYGILLTDGVDNRNYSSSITQAMPPELTTLVDSASGQDATLTGLPLPWVPRITTMQFYLGDYNLLGFTRGVNLVLRQLSFRNGGSHEGFANRVLPRSLLNTIGGVSILITRVIDEFTLEYEVISGTDDDVLNNYGADSVVTNQNIPVTGITLNESLVTLERGTFFQITPTIAPANATVLSVTYSSSDPAITVTSTGLVHALNKGTGLITVTTVDGSFVSTLMVTSEVSVNGVSVTPSTISVNDGETAQLTAVITPGDASNPSVTWASSNPAVATVSALGVVTGVSGGDAIITATTVDGGFQDTASVGAAVSITGFSFAESAITLSRGTPSTQIATITPSTATNQTVIYSASRANQVTLQATSTGVIITPTGSGKGLVTIRGRTEDGSFEDTLAVTITVPVTGVVLTPSNMNLSLNETQQLTASVQPSDANIQTVTYMSDDPSIATVSASGLVTAVGEGSTSVTVLTTDGSFTDGSTITVTIPVTGISITESDFIVGSGSTQQLTAVVTPVNATNTSVNWVSDKPTVATVSSTGLVTGVGSGNANISVITADGGFTDSVRASVSASVESVELQPSSLSIPLGQRASFHANVLPQAAVNKSVTFSQTDGTRAALSTAGLDASLIGLRAGPTDVTVTTTNGGFMDTATATISPIESGISSTPLPKGLNSGTTSGDTMVIAASGDTFVAGFEGGFASRSTDGGATWTALPRGLSSGDSTQFVFSMAASGNNFVAGFTSGYASISTDGGVTWTALPRGLNSGATTEHVSALTASGNTFVAGFRSGYVSISTDGGATWAALPRGLNSGAISENIESIAASGDTFVAGFEGGFASRSTDGGITWTALPRGLNSGGSTQFIFGLAASGETFVAGLSSGYASISTDGGATWTALPRGLNSGDSTRFIYEFAVSGNNFVAGLSSGYASISTDGGATWTALPRGLNSGTASRHVRAIAASGDTFVAGLDDGFASRLTIEEASSEVTLTLPETRTIAPSTTSTLEPVFNVPLVDSRVTWLSSNSAVATVTSGGVVSGMSAGTATITASLVIDPTIQDSTVITVQQPQPESVDLSPDTLSVPLGEARNLVATVLPASAADKSVSFTQTDGTKLHIRQEGNTARVIGLRAGSSTVTSTTTAGGFTAESILSVESLSSGTTIPLPRQLASTAPPGTSTRRIASSGSLVVVGYDDGYASISRDSGHTWNALPRGLGTNSTARLDSATVSGSNIIFASSISGEVFYSSDSGVSWNISSHNLGSVNDLVTNGTTTFATTTFTVSRSTDNGATWVNIQPTAFPGVASFRLVGVQGSRWVITTNNNIHFYSSDEGLTWNSATTNLTNRQRNALIFTEDAIIATGATSEYIRSTDGGVSWTLLNDPLVAGFVSIAEGGGLLVGSNSIATNGRPVSSDDGGLTWSIEGADRGVGTPSTSFSFVGGVGSGAFIFGFGDGYASLANFSPISEVTLGLPETLEVSVGGTGTLTPTFTPTLADPSVTWESDNVGVATVVDGVVAGVGEGTANITATSTLDSGFTDSTEVTIT